MKIPIKEIWEFLGIKVNFTSHERLDLVIGPATFENISLEALKLLKNNDEKRIEIITTIFIDRQIMWQTFEREKIDLCIKSLQSLIDYCNNECHILVKANREDNKLYGKLLKKLASYAIETIKEFEHAKEQIVFINSTARFNDEMSDDWDWIPDILKTFRVKSLPIIKMFIDLLSKSDPQLSQATERFNKAVKILVEHHKVPYNEIFEPYWDYIKNIK